ncbi:MAG: hypothetical protein Q8M19_17145 [Reyranella sp.]|nr:hypothetical protein [Reyranella sp.]
MQVLLELAPYASLLVAIISFIGTLLLWMARKEFATNTSVAAAHRHADAAHHRLDILDERLRGFPGYDVTNELRDDFAEMGKSQAETTTELRLLREQLQRIDDFLRNHR